MAGGQPSVRLCDAALSKDLFPADYHCLGDNDNRPVKWLSLDTIQTGQFAPSTDVWGWGVTMWEILTRYILTIIKPDPRSPIYAAPGPSNRSRTWIHLRWRAISSTDLDFTNQSIVQTNSTR